MKDLALGSLTDIFSNVSDLAEYVSESITTAFEKVKDSIADAPFTQKVYWIAKIAELLL